MTGGSLDHDLIRRFWADKARDERNRWTAAEMLEHELDWLRSVCPRPASILDLGSGHGELSRPLAGASGRLVAVDFAGGYARSFRLPDHVFVEESVTSFETDERFDLVLLFGVVTSLEEADELPLYRRIRAWLDDGGAAVVKNQCALDEEFVVNGYSERLGTEYSGRYPSMEAQRARLESVFADVQVHRYPEGFNPWPTSAHVGFVCRGGPAP